VPGEDEATCFLNPFYCESKEHMQLLYTEYFGEEDPTNADQYELVDRLIAMGIDTQCEVCTVCLLAYMRTLLALQNGSFLL
jgi:hypothetical protein